MPEKILNKGGFMLQVNNASKQIAKTQVLNQINLTIQANSIVGLAGPSGSGKSTLLRCIQQLETLDSGSIECVGQCGFMFQDFQLFPHMTVLDNLMYAPKLLNKGINHELRAAQLLKQLSITDKSNAFPQQLSGGQKQRVALARSLMMNPDLLLCDEPTSGLDMGSINEVVTLLHSIKTMMQVTIIIASHDLTFLTQIAERILVIQQGSLVEDFKTNQIINPISHIQSYY
jgi:polar amino acid transport system ATP-binding protein